MEWIRWNAVLIYGWSGQHGIKVEKVEWSKEYGLE